MSQQLRSEIKKILVQELNLADMQPDDIADELALFGASDSLGLDSLDALQLAVALEEHFQTKIPEGEQSRAIFTNVASIAQFIEQSRKQSS